MTINYKAFEGATPGPWVTFPQHSMGRGIVCQRFGKDGNGEGYIALTDITPDGADIKPPNSETGLARYDSEMAVACANARLIAAAPTLLSDHKRMSAEIERLREALKHVRAIIVDGALTGFNCHSGDWAERLFLSQGVTRAALASSSDQS